MQKTDERPLAPVDEDTVTIDVITAEEKWWKRGYADGARGEEHRAPWSANARDRHPELQTPAGFAVATYAYDIGYNHALSDAARMAKRSTTLCTGGAA